MRIVSWNVNGVRAAFQKGLADFMRQEGADVYCLQEIKAQPEHIEELALPDQYEAHVNSAEKKGYSGTAIFSRVPPLTVTSGIGVADHDKEGRVLTAEFDTFYLVNVYTPNSQRGLNRLSYRVDEWDKAFRKYLLKLDKKKPVVFCGDLNVAHKEIDLANPKSNKRNAGFTEEERDSFSQTLKKGFVDTFRLFQEDGGHYTWWSYMNNARSRNIGWRIDYFCTSERFSESVIGSEILPEVHGSDHCPIRLALDPDV